MSAEFCTCGLNQNPWANPWKFSPAVKDTSLVLSYRIWKLFIYLLFWIYCTPSLQMRVKSDMAYRDNKFHSMISNDNIVLSVIKQLYNKFKTTFDY